MTHQSDKLLPQVGVGAIVLQDNSRILLVKRKNPPSQGLWAIPGGRIQLGETMQDAAEREIYEETGIIIKAESPYFTFDIIEKERDGTIIFHYIIVDLLAAYISGEPVAGDDALDAAWFSLEEISDHTVNETTRKLLHKMVADGIL